MANIEQQTHYESLGVSQDATPEEIKKAFRKLARDNHSDVLADLPETSPERVTAEAKMRRITYAYDVLSDAFERTQYDQKLRFENDHSFSGNLDTDTDDSTWWTQRIFSEQARAERARKLAFYLLVEAYDHSIRKSPLYWIMYIGAVLAHSLSLAAVCFGVVRFAALMSSGTDLAEILTTTAGQPLAISVIPIQFGFGALLLAGALYLCEKLYEQTLRASAPTGWPVRSIDILSRHLKKRNFFLMTVPGVAMCGIVFGYTFF